jgi:hypothetical protein
MGLTAIVTNAGRAALVNAANTGTRAVTIAQVGLSGTALAPEAGATVLPGQFKTIATLSGDVVADDTIHLIVRDESADVFTVRSLALYLADGTLFALYGQADVLLEKSAQALMLLAIDIRFEDVDASAITFGDTNFLNPPATTERQGVVELATVAEAQAGIDALRALTPQAARSAILGWLLAQDGAGSGLDADLLDGQQGSWYTDIPARLGYAPWGPTNRRAGSASTPPTRFAGRQLFPEHSDGLAYPALMGPARLNVWHVGNSGAVLADLLDGLDSSYFVNIPARLGYADQQAGDTFTGLVAFRALALRGPVITPANRDYRVIDDGSLQIDETDGASTSPVISGERPQWHSGNDGAGSGLDRSARCATTRARPARSATPRGKASTRTASLSPPYNRFLGADGKSTVPLGITSAGQPHGGSAPDHPPLYPGPGRPTFPAAGCSSMAIPSGGRTTTARAPGSMPICSMGSRAAGTRTSSGDWAMPRAGDRDGYRPAIQCQQAGVERQQVAADRRHHARATSSPSPIWRMPA